IATATQQSQLHTANENIHLVSGNHTDITAGQSLTAHAAESLNLFAQSSGIKVQANQGKVEVQAQNDELQLNALKDAVLTSSSGRVNIAAQEEVLITCKGAYIKFSNGEIEIGSPKLVRVKAPLEVTGPASMNYNHPSWPKTIPKIPLKLKVGQSAHGGGGFAGMPYVLFADGVEKMKGILNAKGELEIEHELTTGKYKVELANGRVFHLPVVKKCEGKDKYTSKGFFPGSANPEVEEYAKLVQGIFTDNNDAK
ncbi:DUF2345 domain-containing protein, partial [Neisseria macacae]